MVVMWNAETGFPDKTIFKIPEDKILSIDISKNCAYLAMLSIQQDKNEALVSQKITVWDIKTKPRQIFISDFTDDDLEVYNLIRFNPNIENDEMELLINGKSKILFWNINPNNHETIRPYFPIKSKGSQRKGEEDVTSHKKEKTELTNKKEKNKLKENEKKRDKKKEINSKNSQKNYTQSTFLTNTTMAITATSAGYIIVWDVCEALCKDNEIRTDRRKIKTVQLIKHKKDFISDKDSINFLLNYEENIVIGSGDGAIRFYNYNFIIVRWFENVCWTVTSLSFDMGNSNNYSKDSSSIYHMLDEKGNEESANTHKFKCIPFIVCDISASIIRVYNKVGTEIDYNDDHVKYSEIYRGIESNITSIAIHPQYQILAFGVDSKSTFRKPKDSKQKDQIIREKKFEFKPYIQIFHYPDHMKVLKEETRRREAELKNKKHANINDNKNKANNSSLSMDDEKYINPFKRYFDAVPTVLEYSIDGKYLMVGTDDQKIHVLSDENIHNGSELQIKDITDQDSKASISEIKFANNEKYFAASDTYGRIGLFMNENPFSKSNLDKQEWTIVARYHFKNGNSIISFCFSEKSDRLFTICSDGFLYEFEFNFNNDNFSLILKSKIQIEQDCNMTSLVWCPSLGSGKERHLIISNDEFKIRTVLLLPNQESPIIRQTSLGPCYGGPIQKMRIIPGIDKSKRILAFSTDKKIFGLIALPVDGNPYKYMGVIGHPNKIQDIKPAGRNIDFIFTTGGSDFTINAWRYNINPINDAVLNNGSDLKPFLTLLEGGEDGLKFQEMKNFFYYAQIKSKVENTTKQRTLNGTVPKDLIRGLLSSMGFYPSKLEIDNIENEVKYSKYGENEKNIVEGMTFEMFVKIYINHRPYRDLEMEKIEKSFENIKNYVSNTNEKLINKKGINRDIFYQLLKENGDKIDDDELNSIISTLKGNTNEKLPEFLTFEYLFEELLKFEVSEKIEDEN